MDRLTNMEEAHGCLSRTCDTLALVFLGLDRF
jgi:hypothetical protein